MVARGRGLGWGIWRKVVKADFIMYDMMTTANIAVRYTGKADDSKSRDF